MYNPPVASHKFDLFRMRVGVSFLGCPKCGFQHEPGIAVRPECPNCHAGMNFYRVTKEDMEAAKGESQ